MPVSHSRPLRSAYLPALLAGGLSLLPAMGVHAGTTMVVDDAEIVDARSCQLESWAYRESGYHEFWFVPACSYVDNLETSLGMLRSGGTEALGNAFMAEAKYRLREMDGDDWGVSVAVNVMQARHAGARSRDWGINVPISRAFADESFFVHVNVGWQRNAGDANHATWGLGSEKQLGKSGWLLAEIYDEADGETSYQVGYRHEVIADLLEIDMTVGDRFGNTRARHAALGIWLGFPL